MKVALVYDRVNKWGGAERVLLALHEIFPSADLVTSVYDKKGAPWASVFPEVKTSFLQKIPFVSSKHEWFPYLMPWAFESLNLKKYDFVISVTSESAKGILTDTNTKHICYCLTPTRYLWSGYTDYFKNPFLRTLSRPAVSYLKKWERVAAKRPDKMIAISTEVKKRIKKYYKRKSKIIFPPVDLSIFKSKEKKRENFYLLVGRLVPYKRVDLAISAFNKLGLPLVIVGTGSEEQRLRRIAKKNITFVNRLTDEKLIHYYGTTKGLIFPQREDFGLVAVEAQAVGAPVIAYKKGGALDSVVDNKTGVFFEKQSQESLISAVERFEGKRFNEDEIKQNVKRFSKEMFRQKFLEII